MGDVVVNASMSLDGYVADPSGGVGELFDWYSNGDVEVTLGDTERVFTTTAASAEQLRRAAASTGACVIGRRLFDLTDGWGGRPSVGDAVVVVTHHVPDAWVDRFPDAPFTFVTAGVAAAVEAAQALAGERDVAVTAGDVAGQALELGLVDEVRVDLVPVVFGSGVRFFGAFEGAHRLLEDPTVVAGERVTHLRFAVRRP